MLLLVVVVVVVVVAIEELRKRAIERKSNGHSNASDNLHSSLWEQIQSVVLSCCFRLLCTLTLCASMGSSDFRALLLATRASHRERAHFRSAAQKRDSNVGDSAHWVSSFDCAVRS